jgi:hypothetical protein
METDRQRMFRRLGYYLIGVAVSCVFLGLIQMGRKRAVAEQAAAEAASKQGAKQVVPAGGQPGGAPGVGPK